MISELIQYYDRLLAVGNERVAPEGCSWQNVGFAVVLELDGRLHAIEDRRQEVYPTATKKNPNPKPYLTNRKMILPGLGGRTSGIRANLCWDKAEYLFAYKGKRPEATFKAFRDKHLALESQINAPEFSAVCRFIEQWQPGNLTKQQRDLIDRCGMCSGVFQIRGQQRYVHELPEVEAYLERERTAADTDDRPLVQSCVSGQWVRPALKHTLQIKGVKGANSKGAALISYNFNATESYGMEHAGHAPMSDSESFRLHSVLNVLTSFQRVYIGDTTLVYWTDAPPATATAAELLLGFALGKQAEDGSLKAQLQSALAAIARGKMPGSDYGDVATSYYVLGLDGNQGRINIRYFHEGTLGELYTRMRDHFSALATEREWPDKQPEFPSVWQLLQATVRKHNGKSEEVAVGLPEALLQSILNGTDYPATLYAAVLRRITTEGTVGYLRASIINATLTRNYKMEKDEIQNEPSYQLGRLLAVLEHLQSSAVGSSPINSCFGAASTTPALVFPRLISGSQPHYAKLRSMGQKGRAIWYEKLVQEILWLGAGYPQRFSLREQGAFGFGYYHQRRMLYSKAPIPAAEAEATLPEATVLESSADPEATEE
jgi:CRISPR-associated protein Csd1